MKILVNDFAGHPFPAQLSRFLALSGHEVLHTYFAANNTPKGNLTTTLQNLAIEPISIGREFKKLSLLSRRASDVAYGTAVSRSILTFRPDVVLSANTPLDAQQKLLAATRAVGGSFLFWLQDVLSVGIEFVLRRKRVPLSRFAGYIYGRMERRLLQQSDAIICIAPEFEERLRTWGVAHDLTFTIENWAPLDEVVPSGRCNRWSAEHDLDGKFVFMYSGTLGMKHKPEMLLQLAKRFENNPDVVVMVIAEGGGADWLKRHATDVRPGALEILSFQPYNRVSEVLSSADVLLTILDPDCGSFAVPSKTLAYLCAGRAQLMAAPAENLAARVLSSANAGILVSASTNADFVAAAEFLHERADQRAEYARNARKYAEFKFDIRAIGRRFLYVIESAAMIDEPLPVGKKAMAATNAP